MSRHLRLLIIMIIATFGYLTLIDSAALPSQGFVEKLSHVAIQDNLDEPDNEHNRTVSSFKKMENYFCITEPCGWYTYSPSTRDIISYISNTCTCHKSYKCIRTKEDVSVAAYVYHCRQNTSEDAIEAPEEVY